MVASASEPRDEQALLAELDKPLDAGPAYRVAYELGQIRSARGLAKLVSFGAKPLINGFSHGMGLSERDNRKQPLSPELEEVIVEHFDHPKIGSELQGLVMRGKYRTRELFDQYHQALKRPGITGPEYHRLAGHVVRTDLHVEKEILELLSISPSGTNADQGRLALSRFLADRRYIAAAPLLERNLAKAERNEAYITCEYLAKLGTKDSVLAAISYAEKLRHGPDAERADRLVQTLLRVLEQLPPEAPVDLAVVRRMIPDPMPFDMAESYIRLVRHRRDADALPELLAFVSQGPGAAGARTHYHSASGAILALEDPNAWREAKKTIEQLRAEGKIPMSAVEPLTRELERRLADPAKALAEGRSKRLDEQRGQELSLAVRQVETELRKVETLAQQAPDRFVSEYGEHLSKLETLANRYADVSSVDSVKHKIASGYLRLGSVIRFTQGRPEKALSVYAKAIPYEESASFAFSGEKTAPWFLSLSRLAIADTYEHDLGKKKDAASEIEALLRQARASKRHHDLDVELAEEWLIAALENDAEWLKSNSPYGDEITKDEGIGFFSASYFLIMVSGSLFQVPGVTAQGGEQLDAAAAVRHLTAFRPSRFALLQSLPYLGYVSAEEIVSFLEKHDPGRYWAGSILVAATAMTSSPDAQSSEFRLFSLPEDSKQPNPFPIAAKRFAKMTGIRLSIEPEERFSTPEKTWTFFLVSLRQADRRAVRSCLGTGALRTLGRAVAEMPDDEVRQLGATFEPTIELQRKDDDWRVYKVTSEQDGKEVSGPMIFRRRFGEWKIDEH